MDERMSRHWLFRTLTLVVALCSWMLPGAARATAFDEAVRQLGGADPQQSVAAVSTLAASGDDRARAILSALQEGDLRYDGGGKAFIVTQEATVSALGDGAVPQGSLEKPLVNNAVRRALRPAVAQLELRAKDRSVRLAAVVELAKRPAEELMEPMRQALV